MRFFLVCLCMAVAIVAALAASNWYENAPGRPLFDDQLNASQMSTIKSVRWIVGLITMFTLGGLVTKWDGRRHAARVQPVIIISDVPPGRPTKSRPGEMRQLSNFVVFVVFVLIAIAIYRAMTGS